MPDRFHLGWFCNFSSGEWNHPFASGLPPWDGKIFVEMAQAMELVARIARQARASVGDVEMVDSGDI